MNASLEIETSIEEDFFWEVYDGPIIQALYLVHYAIGLMGIGGIALIIWFERSGEAGQFRTLVNQLVSMNLDQVTIWFISKEQVGITYSGLTNLLGNAFWKHFYATNANLFLNKILGF